MKKPELLAPAGGWDAFVAAVENGADAVYLGGSMFNARQSAENFDDGHLKRAVEYAHLRGVKIYVTVNTLIADSEMEDALEFIYTVQSTGADAAIIQDPGLAALARRAVPELQLHASTQMTAHNSPGVRALLEQGFSRVVLARELSIKEIRQIKDSTGAELEVFIHGALCISYSGQCLISSMIGGRSGNRGRCAQPCRMQYILTGGAGGSPLVNPAEAGEYLLSPRDLNISAHISELVAAGISSFKIEGRMKRPEYVATVVRVYRSLIDRALSGGPYYVEEKQEGDLAQIFNRDFTTGYFFGARGRDMMSCKRPNNRGVRLGRVKGFDRKTGLVEVALEGPLRPGDGLEVWVTEGGRVGFQVGEIFVRGARVERAVENELAGLAIPGRVKPGDRVFKTHDADLMELARESFTSPRPGRKIPLVFKVTASRGDPLEINVTDPEGRTAGAATRSAGTPAEKRPLGAAFLESQLDRLGNTPFSLARLDCEIKGEIIYPLGEINEARREALARLEEMTLRDRRRSPLDREVFRARLLRSLARGGAGVSAGRREKPVLAVSVGDIKSVRSAVAAGAGIVYFGMDGLRSKPPAGTEELVEAAEFCRKNGVEFWLNPPRILKDGDMVGLLDAVGAVPAAGVLAGNLGLMRALVQKLADLPVAADFGLNAFNRHTVEYLLEKGVARVTLSPELTMAQVKYLAGQYPVEVFVQGALELMVCEHCLPGAALGERSEDGPCGHVCRGRGFGLKDRTGAVFPVETDRYCRMHIFNSRDLCLIDDIPELAEAGVCSIRIEARRQSPGYVSAAVEIYRRALDGLSGGKRCHPDTAKNRERLLSMSPAGLTKGHYYRGV